MALNAYFSQNVDSKITSTTPFTVTFDGRYSGAQYKCIYLRNDDPIRWYSNIQVSLVDSSGNDITDNSMSGWVWKLISKETRPLLIEWDEITPGNTIALSDDIGSATLIDISTYLPVWVYVSIPRGQKIQTITDVKIRISTTEHLIV